MLVVTLPADWDSTAGEDEVIHGGGDRQTQQPDGKIRRPSQWITRAQDTTQGNVYITVACL